MSIESADLDMALVADHIRRLDRYVDAKTLAEAAYLLVHLYGPPAPVETEDLANPGEPTLTTSAPEPGTRPKGPLPTLESSPSPSSPPADVPPPAPAPASATTPFQSVALPDATRRGGPSRVAAGEYAVSDARAMPNLRLLARALNFLRRQVKDPRRLTLDVDKTVAGWAEQLLANVDMPLCPEMKSTGTKWAEIALVVDRSPTMAFWRAALSEIEEMLRWQGAFRDVRLWEIDTVEKPDGKGENSWPRLYAVPTPLDEKPPRNARNYKELISPSRDRLVVVLTDCMSEAWWDGRAFQLLYRLGMHGGVAIWHVLPQKLWNNTAIGTPQWLATAHSSQPSNIELVASPRAGAWNSLIDPDGISFKDTVPLPIVELGEAQLQAWSRVQAGLSRAAVPALVLRPDLEALENEEDCPSIAELLARFRSNSTANARQLARYLTAVPLSLGVMRLVQRVMLPDSTQSDLAIVLMSGLMSPREGTGGENIRFDWHPDAKKKLSEKLGDSDVRFIHRRVGEQLGVQAETIRKFAALIAEGREDEAKSAALLTVEDEFALIAAKHIPPVAKPKFKTLPSAPIKIFIGGSFVDMAEYREAAIEALEQIDGIAPVGDETRLGPSPISELLLCHAAVFLIGAQTSSGGVVREYEAAVNGKIPCFVFLKGDIDAELCDPSIRELRQAVAKEAVFFEGEPSGLKEVLQKEVLAAQINGLLSASEQEASQKLVIALTAEQCGDCLQALKYLQNTSPLGDWWRRRLYDYLQDFQEVDPSRFVGLTKEIDRLDWVLSIPLYLDLEIVTPLTRLKDSWERFIRFLGVVPIGWALVDRFKSQARITRFSFHPYMPARLAIPTHDHSVHEWDVADNSSGSVWHLNPEATLINAYWTEANDGLGFVYSNGQVQTPDRITHSILGSTVTSAECTSTGRLAIASGTGFVVTDRNGRHLWHRVLFRSVIQALAWHADNKRVAFVAQDRQVGIYDRSKGKGETRNFERASTEAKSLAWLPDGIHLVTGMINGDLVVWNSATGKQVETYSGHTDAIESLSVSAQGDPQRILAAYSRDGRVSLWHIKNNALLRYPQMLPEAVSEEFGTYLAFHPTDPNLLAVLSNEGLDVRLWHLDRQKMRSPVTVPAVLLQAGKTGTLNALLDIAQQIPTLGSVSVARFEEDGIEPLRSLIHDVVETSGRRNPVLVAVVIRQRSDAIFEEVVKLYQSIRHLDDQVCFFIYHGSAISTVSGEALPVAFRSFKSNKELPRLIRDDVNDIAGGKHKVKKVPKKLGPTHPRAGWVSAILLDLAAATQASKVVVMMREGVTLSGSAPAHGYADEAAWALRFDFSAHLFPLTFYKGESTHLKSTSLFPDPAYAIPLMLGGRLVGAVILSGPLLNLTNVDPESLAEIGGELVDSELFAATPSPVASHAPASLTQAAALANTYWNIGWYEEARNVFEEVLNIRRVVLGERHPDTLEVADGLARLYWVMGLYEDAYKLATQTHEALLGLFGNDQGSTIESESTLADIYWSLGRYGEAIKLGEEVLAKLQAKHGDFHSEVLFSMNGLASNYRAMGRYSEALNLADQVLSRGNNALRSMFPSISANAHNVLAQAYRSLGRYQQALESERTALSTWEGSHGEYHPYTFTSKNILSYIHLDLGQYQSALELGMQALDGQGVALGSNHPYTLMALNNLSNIHRALGQYQDSFELGQEALAGLDAALGRRHHYTLFALNDLARTFLARGRFKDAHTLQTTALALRTEILGAQHPDTLSTRHDLAATALEMGRDEDALRDFTRAFEQRKIVLGARHPDTIASQAGIGNAQRGLGRFEEAVRQLSEAVNLQTEVLGNAHPETLTIMCGLAATYVTLGRFEEARSLYAFVLTERTHALGERHPHTLETINDLGIVARAQGRYDVALDLLETATDGLRKTLGGRHSLTLSAINELASTYWVTGRYEDSLKLHLEALPVQEDVLGERHTNTITAINELANTYWSMGNYQEADKHYQRAYNLRREVFGEYHPDTLGNANNLANNYWSMDRFEDALKIHEEVAERRKQILGERHPDTLVSMNNLASTYWALGRFESTLKIQESVLEIRREVLGERHPDTLTSLHNLASTYHSLARYTQALALGREAWELREEVLGDKHPDTLTSAHNLACTLEATGKHRQAIDLQEETLRAREEVLGAQHPDTILSRDCLKNWTSRRKGKSR